MEELKQIIKLTYKIIQILSLISTTKDSYFLDLGKKLSDPKSGPKSYWSILKRFLNKIKLPTVPPLLVNRMFVTDFRKKASIFNIFFAEQCSIFYNGSVLPGINYKIHKRLTNITILNEDLFRIIKDLNPNKAHGHDNISIKMIQICGDSIIPPLKMIFESAIKSSYFPDS